MKQQKSRSLDRISRQQEQIRQKVNHFLKETQKTKIIYPRKNKLSSQYEIISQAREMQELEKQTPKLMSKFTSKDDVVSHKRSLNESNAQRDDSQSRKSVLSKYQQPKIIESSAIQKHQKLNPEKYQSRGSLRESNRSHIKSKNHIFQQSNYTIDDPQNSQRFNSARQNQRMFTEVVSKVGIRNHYDQNEYNQFTDLKGIHQFIRKKKNSGTSSTLGKAYTEPPEKLEIIQEREGSSSFRFKNPEKKRNVARSESSFKNKHDLFIPFDQGGSYLPEIEKSRSLSKLLNKKIKTQTSTPNFIKEDFRKELKKKMDKSLGKQKSSLSKQPSTKRLLQDYKYVLEKDDSQRIRQRSKPLLNEEKKKLKFLKIKEEMLGKIVLQRVQKHLDQEKKLKPNYITKVKSEKSIDEALVEFLKMKVKRADKALNQ